MNIKVEKNYEDLSLAAAELVASRLKKRPYLVLGLPTGVTPIGLYENLVEVYNKGAADFLEVTTFNLDEYCGLSPEHPESYRAFMERHLFGLINIPFGQTHFPLCDEKSCMAYEEMITVSGGIDLQILGIGRNGHIGFNEPGSAFDSRSRVVRLTEATTQNNAQFFGSVHAVPKMAATMGIGTIMEAGEILLLASGSGKAEIIKKALKGPVTPEIPASILQRHKKFTVILDQESAAYTITD